MAFLGRHPRYIFALLLTLLACISILLFERPPRVSLAVRLDSQRGSKSLRGMLLDEEELYKEAIKDREALVRKWGPTAEDIAMCVVPSS